MTLFVGSFVKDKKIVDSFLALVRAGLLETEVRLPAGDVDCPELFRLAQEQAVVGLVAAGLEHVPEAAVEKKEVLAFVGNALQLEQRNAAMNHFIGGLVERMRAAGIMAVLVKGQGVAQCYARPLWRACGDVDFLLRHSNYEQAKEFIRPLASFVEAEDVRKLHQAMTIDSWTVELHGKLSTELSTCINAGLDEVQRAVFDDGEVRSWDDDGVTVLLPSADNDAVIIFTHFIQHFFIGGVGLRQICDWCRLLFTFKDNMDRSRLLLRLKKMDLMAEWKAFASFAVEYLGMPSDAMPFYEQSTMNSRRAGRLLDLILETGNFGHNIDESYRSRYPYPVQLVVTFWRRLGGFMHRFMIFPGNSPKFFLTYVTRRAVASF